MEASRLLAAFIVCDVTVRLCFIEPAMASCGVRVKWSDGETNSVQLRELFKQLLCIPNFLNPPQHFGPGQQTQSTIQLLFVDMQIVFRNCRDKSHNNSKV